MMRWVRRHFLLSRTEALLVAGIVLATVAVLGVSYLSNSRRHPVPAAATRQGADSGLRESNAELD